MQIENLHIHVYRMLHLSPSQRVALASHWHLWERRRRSLDGPITAAHDHLSSLPQFIPLPEPFARRIFAIADGSIPPPRHAQHVQHAQHNPAPWDQQPVVPLLGAAADVTAAAEEVGRLLQYSTATASSIGIEMSAQRWQPGALMGLPQLLRLCSVHLFHRHVPQVDFMALCQLAATQARWEESRQRQEYAQWQALQASFGEFEDSLEGGGQPMFGQWGHLGML